MIHAPFLVPLVASLCAPAPASEPSGTYVEARTLSVFAGACHYSGEQTTAGREAVMAWSIESGSYDDVDLSGARVALAVVDDVNLVDEPAARRAVVYVDAGETDARAAALLDFVRANVPALTVDVREVRRQPIDVRVDDAGYRLSVGSSVELTGGALPDRACCKMPFQVWYEPFAPVSARLVGRDETFRFDEPALGRSWSRPGENSAFFGRFGDQERVAAR